MARYVFIFALVIIIASLAFPARADLLKSAQDASEELGRDMLAVPTGKAAAPAPGALPGDTSGQLTILVADEAKALDPASLKHLKASAASAAGSTGVRFAIIVVPSLKHERVDFAAATAAGVHDLIEGRDAVVLLIALKEKQGWIWTSSGLVSVLTSGMKQAVLDYIMLPNLKQGNVARAAEDSTRAVALALASAGGKVQADEGRPATEILPSGLLPLLVGGTFLALIMGSAGWTTLPIILYRRI